MWFLYQIATILALLVAGPFLLASRGSHYLASLPGRLGRYTGAIPEDPLWIHAVSVGEVGVAHTLAKALPADMPILITTVTPTGQALAQRLFADRGTVAYLPFDLGPLVEKFLNRYRPRALVMVEGDLWPLLLARSKARHLPIAVVNGRVSDRGYRRMSRLKRLLGPLFRPVDRFGMQSEMDRRRLEELGVATDRLEVTGNLKFETPTPHANPDLIAAVGEVAGDRPILVAGSTMQGEEEQVLAALERIGGGGRALLILAPRHPERWNEVAEKVKATGFELLRRTDLETTPTFCDVLLLDSLGELAALYGAGLGSFIGGTLVPTGGHNPLEAALHAVAVSAGPSMENFRDIALEFDRHQAWARAGDAQDLARIWDAWISEPAAAMELGRRGREVVTANQGSLAATMTMLMPLIRSPSAAPRGAGDSPS